MTSALTAPSRRRSSGFIMRSSDADPAIMEPRQHRISVLPSRLGHIELHAELAEMPPGGGQAKWTAPIGPITPHEIDRGERRIVELIPRTLRTERLDDQ